MILSIIAAMTKLSVLLELNGRKYEQRKKGI